MVVQLYCVGQRGRLELYNHLTELGNVEQGLGRRDGGREGEGEGEGGEGEGKGERERER